MKQWDQTARLEVQERRIMPDIISFFPSFWKVLVFFFFNTWYSASLKSVELHRGKTDKRKLNLLKKTYYYGFEEVKLVSLVS